MDDELYIIAFCLQYHVTSSGDGGVIRVCQTLLIEVLLLVYLL